ncbi:MAG: xanthine dehydrogenase family protein subunit M [Deltaproteobacteria bacterium]|nr:xanthine dehydrogenase family protein subunit M [Deltaproteobacteria bacterium]
MRNFDLLEPKTVTEACRMLDDGEDVRPVSGGTALLILIKQGLLRPQTLVNLKKLEGANAITRDAAGAVRIEAMATIHEVETSPVVREHLPVLAAACHQVANIRIRHLATIGGNLAHGDHQSDPPGVLVALDAEVELSATQGSRAMKFADFLLGTYETALEPGEMVTAVTVPPVRGRLVGDYLKFTTGSSEERPCAGITALVRLEDHRPVEARLVVGAVAARPLLLCGTDPTEGALQQMAERAAEEIDPIPDLHGSAEYKRHLVRVLGRRALAAAWQEACP